MRVSCMKPFFSFTFFNKSPSASVVWENAATLFCCEAPEIVWERWIFIRLSVSMEVNTCDNIWIFGVNCTFKIPVQSKAPSLIWMEVVFHCVTFSIHSYFWLSPPTTPSITDDRVETRYLLTLTACYWFNPAGLIFHCVSVDMISALFSTREQLPKEFFFTTAAVYLATTGKLREDSCGRRKERERHGNKKDKQFDLLFLPISSGRPPP